MSWIGRITTAVALSGLCLMIDAGCGASPPREVIVVARGMTFLLPGDSDTANPVIRLRAGERVRLVFRNEAPGLLHNFQVPSWDVTTEQIRAGETTTVVFVVPTTLGRYEYTCRPHAELMHGFVEVTE